MKTTGLAFALCLLPSIGSAHHSFQVFYDAGQTLEIEGEITRVAWVNPHVELTLRDADGESWVLETNSVSILRRMDISADFVSVGARVRVAGNPARRRDNAMAVWNILLPSGQEVVLGPTQEARWADRGIGTSATWLTRNGASTADVSIFRVWSTSLTDRRSFPFHRPGESRPLRPSEYPLTVSARASLEGFDPETDDPTRNCSAKGMPEIVNTPYPQQFVDEGDRILHRIEEYDTVRTIYMEPRDVVATLTMTRLGYSVGHWEDNSLVVRTTNVDWGHFNSEGIPLSAAAEVVERFTLSTDGSRLDYLVEVTDPGTFTETVVLQRHWIWIPGATVEPYNCTS